MADVNIPDSILEKFRCSVCLHYLSCAPVQILPNGHSICNVCSSSTEEPTYRHLLFEDFLSKLSFPCRFKNHGCEERVPFGQASIHEDNCPFHAYNCPVLPNGACVWEGSTMEIADHFTKEHSNLIKERIEFKLRVDQNKQEVLIVTIDGVGFIIKYMYDASTYNLQYDLRYLTRNVQEGIYKIQLTSDSDNDYSVTLKGGNCSSYNSHFYGKQDSKLLILSNCMQILNNPDCVAVTMNVAVTKFPNENASVDHPSLGFDLLQRKRCAICQGYLIPPLFGFDYYAPVCYHCHLKNPLKYNKPLEDDELNKRLAEANYSCRWRGCKFIGKAENFLKHESACQFRIFNCTECEDTFIWEEALVHLQNHGHEYFDETYVYKIVFRKPYSQKKIFTFKDNEIIFVGHETKSKKHETNISLRYTHVINPYSTGSCLTKVDVEFECCKIKSKTFSVGNSGCSIYLHNLPACFKSDDELTVTVKI